MKQVNMHEAKSQLSRLVQLAEAGEEIVIANRGRPVVRLVALVGGSRQRRLGTEADFLIGMAEDFDEELSDFSEYMPHDNPKRRRAIHRPRSKR